MTESSICYEKKVTFNSHASTKLPHIGNKYLHKWLAVCPSHLHWCPRPSRAISMAPTRRGTSDVVAALQGAQCIFNPGVRPALLAASLKVPEKTESA